MCLAPSKNLFRVVRAAKKLLFQALAIFWSAGKQCRNFFFLSVCHHLSTVILANTTIVAFVLLRNARFSFLCYTWCEPVPTLKSARKCSCDLLRLLARKIMKGIYSCKPALLNCPIGLIEYSCCLGKRAVTSVSKSHQDHSFCPVTCSQVLLVLLVVL